MSICTDCRTSPNEIDPDEFCRECWRTFANLFSDENELAAEYFLARQLRNKEINYVLPKYLRTKVEYKPKHKFEMTFTTDKDDVFDLLTRMKSVLTSKMLAATKTIISFELTQNKLPHAHCLVYTDKPKVEYSKLRALYSDKAGALHISPIQDEPAYIKYITKQHADPELINYFLEKLLPIYTEFDGTSWPTSLCSPST